MVLQFCLSLHPVEEVKLPAKVDAVVVAAMIERRADHTIPDGTKWCIVLPLEVIRAEDINIDKLLDMVIEEAARQFEVDPRSLKIIETVADPKRDEMAIELEYSRKLDSKHPPKKKK
jgi:hypothetical protein